MLAAGAGRRFGGAKAVALVAGERLVDRAVRLLADGGCQPVVVVAGATPLEVPGALVVENPRWRTGMSTSLQVGLASVSGERRDPDHRGRTMARPGIGPAAARGPRGGRDRRGRHVRGRRGHPVLLARAHFSRGEGRRGGRRRARVPRRAPRTRHAGALRRDRLSGRCGHPGGPRRLASAAAWPEQGRYRRQQSGNVHGEGWDSVTMKGASCCYAYGSACPTVLGRSVASPGRSARSERTSSR